MPDSYWRCTGELVQPNPDKTTIAIEVRIGDDTAIDMNKTTPNHLFATLYFWNLPPGSQMPNGKSMYEFNYYPGTDISFRNHKTDYSNSRSQIEVTSIKDNHELIHFVSSGNGAEANVNIDLNRRNTDGSFAGNISAKETGYSGDTVWTADAKNARCYPGPLRKK